MARKPQESSFAWFGLALLTLCVYFSWHQLGLGTIERPSKIGDSQPTQATPKLPPGEAFRARVIAVADGDSLVIRSDSPSNPNSSLEQTVREVRVRLEGIDAPEFGQPFHRRAKRFLSNACLGKSVIVQSHETDRYGRLVARVFLNKADSAPYPEYDTSRMLLDAGLAWHFIRYNNEADLAAAETNARSRRLGLWQDPNPVAPWDWRNLRNN